jgi:hypothetical protein
MPNFTLLSETAPLEAVKDLTSPTFFGFWWRLAGCGRSLATEPSNRLDIDLS